MRLRPPLVAALVQFPRALDPDTVTQFLRAVAASPARTIVSLEVVAVHGHVQHFVVCQRSQARTVQRHLLTHVPGLRLQEAELPGVVAGAVALVRVRQRGVDYQLDVDQVVAASRQFLESLASVRRGEQVWLRLTLAPAGRARPGPPPPSRWQAASTAGFFTSPDPLPRSRARDAKRSEFGLWVEASVRVTAGDAGRARALARTTTGHLRLLTSALSGLSVVPAGWWGRRRFEARTLQHWNALLLNVQEAAGLLGWPLDLDHAPGLQLGLSRLLPAPTGLATRGVSLGRSSSGRAVRLADADRVRHLHVVGPSGVGKSTLLAGMALQDMKAGRAVIVVDPKADLVRDLLARVPEERVQDVIVVDPTAEAVVGFNPLGGSGPAETRAEHVLHVFRSLFADSWGPRTDDILRACLLTLTSSRGVHTLAELPLLLTNPNIRQQLVASVDDPFGVAAFWAGYESLSPENQLQHSGPVLNKLRALLMRPRLRAMVGQPGGLDFADVMRERRIVLVPLSGGTLGAEAAHLLGSLLLLNLWQAVQARAQHELRPLVSLYLDEFQELLHLPVPLDEALVQARGLGLGLHLSHQHLGQLTPSVRAAVLSSARNRVVFTTARADAKVLADELGPLVTPDDLQGLPAFEAMARLVHEHQTLPPLSLTTQPLTPVLRDPRELARVSATAWGRPRADVERDLRRLLEPPADDAPIGRRRLR